MGIQAMHTYRFSFQFLSPDEGGRYMGGVPADPKLVETWLSALQDRGEELPDQELIDRMDRQATVLDERTLKVTTTFARLPPKNGVQGEFVIPAHVLKGLLKETVKGLMYGKKYRGIGVDLQIRSFIRPRCLLTAKTEPTGVTEYAARVQTPMGPRSVLRRKEWLDLSEVPFTFDLDVVPGCHLDSLPVLASIWEFAQTLGLGGGRRVDEGRFKGHVVGPIAQ